MTLGSCAHQSLLDTATKEFLLSLTYNRNNVYNRGDDNAESAVSASEKHSLQKADIRTRFLHLKGGSRATRLRHSVSLFTFFVVAIKFDFKGARPACKVEVKVNINDELKETHAFSRGAAITWEKDL